MSDAQVAEVASPIQWVGIIIDDLRGCRGTYSMYSIHPVPDIQPLTVFASVRTLDDVTPAMKQLIERNSYTACYFDEEDAPIFFRDQQDCCVWWLDQATGRVYAGGKFVGNPFPTSQASDSEASSTEDEASEEEFSEANSTLVAPNLAVFLTRTLLENTMARKKHTDIDRATAKELANLVSIYSKFYATLPDDGVKQYFSIFDAICEGWKK